MGIKDKIFGLFGWGGGSIPKKLRQRPQTPEGIKVPKWAQEDYYAQKDLGMMAPPEELAPEFEGASESGDFLRKKLDGGERVQRFENTKENSTAPRRQLGMQDGEIEDFLGGVLEKKPRKD